MSSSFRLLVMVSTTAIISSVVLDFLPPCTVSYRSRNSGRLCHRYEETQLERSGGSTTSTNPNDEYTSLYLTNLDAKISEEMLNQMLSGFGKITSLIIAKDFKGESRGFAFVDYENAGEAERAAKFMNGKPIGSKVVFVERSPKKEGGRDNEPSWFW